MMMDHILSLLEVLGEKRFCFFHYPLVDDVANRLINFVLDPLIRFIPALFGDTPSSLTLSLSCLSRIISRGFLKSV
jgi:hypothetical protein